MNLKESKNKKITNRILFVVGFLLFAYVATRAYLLSFTWDESYSYLRFARNGITNLNHFDDMSANNHLLNTWLMIICSKIFGVSEFSLRLPNLLSYLLFLIYSAKLVKHLLSNILIIAAFLILNLNPYLLDFFSLARGYGLSIGLMMASLYYAYKFIQRKENYLSAFISVLFASLAILANFTLIIYFLSITGLFVLINYFRVMDHKSLSTQKKFILMIRENLLICSPLAILIFVGPIITNLNNAGALFYGGESGFWNDTVFSLITQFTYGNPFMHFLRNGIQIGVALVLIASVVMIFIHLKTKKETWKSFYLLFIAIVILLCFLANFCQGTIMGMMYLTNRTGLFYYPLFIILMVFLFDLLILKKKKVFTGILLGFTLVFITNFILSINFHYVIQWKKEADVKDMMAQITELNTDLIGEKKPKNISLSIPKDQWLYGPDINFYQQKDKLDWIKLIPNENYKDSVPDYFFIEKIEMYKLKGQYGSDYPFFNYKIIKEYPTSEMLLVEVKKP